MKILIIGASGLVGKALYERFGLKHEVIGTYNSKGFVGGLELDITKEASTQEMIERVQPSWVLMPASLTAVDVCEEDKGLAWQVNVEGTRNVSRACAKGGAKLVYFSSDYVFDGKNGPYKEDDRTGPINFYGRTKFEAERIVRETVKDYLIIRVSGVYGWDGRGSNYVMQVINTLKAHRPIKAASDLVGKPTFVRNISDMLHELIMKDKRGIYHLAGKDVMSRYEIATCVAEAFDLDKHLISRTSAEALNQRAQRPLNSVLDTHKIEDELETKPMGFREGLLLMKGELN